VLDSLRYWAEEMHVDGFRFDLASIFTRGADGSIHLEDPPIIAEISSDPRLSGLRLIAETWDSGAYQLGRSFPGISWLQWNDRFRDDVRSFVRGDPGQVPALMRRLYGSDDCFPDSLMDACRPFQSLNFVTCHDGFTLYDLVAYDRKHNEANGHANRDGLEQNVSWNCGWEGDDGAPAQVLALRRRQAKNLLCLLLLANGTPLLRAGDEFLHTQKGNNNPYNQDNETTWLDWARLDANRDVFRFAKHMIAFRKAHRSLARSRFWRGDVTWHGVGPEPDMRHVSHSLAFHLRGASVGDLDLYVMVNAWWEALPFTIQAPGRWLRVVDTALESPADIAEPGAEPVWPDRIYTVHPRSVVVLRSPLARNAERSATRRIESHASPFGWMRRGAIRGRLPLSAMSRWVGLVAAVPLASGRRRAGALSLRARWREPDRSVTASSSCGFADSVAKECEELVALAPRVLEPELHQRGRVHRVEEEVGEKVVLDRFATEADGSQEQTQRGAAALVRDLSCQHSQIARGANDDVADDLERLAPLRGDGAVERGDGARARCIGEPAQDVVEQPHVSQVGLDVIEDQRIQYLAEQEQRVPIVRDALCLEVALVSAQRALAQRDDQDAIRTEAQRGRERGVETQTAIDVVGRPEPNGREDAGDRGGGERVRGADRSRAGDHGGVARPARHAVRARFYEHDDAAGRHFGGCDAQRAQVPVA
jgi:hypothetical protein